MSIEDQIAALEAMNLIELRAEWERRVGVPTRMRSPDFMRRLLAWSLQAEAEPWAVEELHRSITRATAPRTQALTVGLRMVREWKGRRHEAEVTPDGIRYDGQTFDNLSQVARAITGTRWNGPRFFGLRGQA